MKQKFKKTVKIISIKRAIDVNDDLKQFIFMNSNYRRHVWNDFVAEYHRCTECGEKFDPWEYRSEYFHQIEEPSHVYETYCIGISEQVANDFKSSMRRMHSVQRETGKRSKPQFKKFDRFRCSFKVRTKPTYLSLTGIDNVQNLYSRVRVVSDDQISFRVSHGKTIQIHLREKLFNDAIADGASRYWYTDKRSRYRFKEDDIREICFMHNLNKFYVQLSVQVTFINLKREDTDIAGIDYGIHTPIALWDGADSLMFGMDQKTLNRIHYLERRIARLNSILDSKTYYSKNYFKVLRKLRVSWRRIENIRWNWRNNLASAICKKYSTIVADEFRISDSIHTKNKVSSLPHTVTRKLNHFILLQGIGYLMVRLEETAENTATRYFLSEPDTTRTCSKCGHINPHLKLEQRTFVCESCGYSVDRDINAAKNCYAYAQHV